MTTSETVQDEILVKEFGIEQLAVQNVLLMKKQILEIPENPETKEQYESARKFNVDAKKLLPRIEERRKELKAPILKKGKAIDSTAKKVVEMIHPLIELSGSRRKSWEDVKAAEKKEKEMQESKRLESIQAQIKSLSGLAAKPLEYNRTAEAIARDLAHLETFEISMIDFQERKEEAELIKANAVINAKMAFENRKKFESDQAEAERIKIEQAAESNRLKKERAKIDAERKAKDEADKKAAEAEAAIRRQEEEFIRTERKKLEKEKAAAEKAMVIAERESVWDIAHIDNKNFDHEAALVDHKTFKISLQAEMDLARAEAKLDWARSEKYKAEESERLKLIGPDKLMINTTAAFFDDWISNAFTPHFETSDAMSAYCDLISRFHSAIKCFEDAGKTLK